MARLLCRCQVCLECLVLLFSNDLVSKNQSPEPFAGKAVHHLLSGADWPRGALKLTQVVYRLRATSQVRTFGKIADSAPFETTWWRPVASSLTTTDMHFLKESNSSSHSRWNVRS